MQEGAHREDTVPKGLGKTLELPKRKKRVFRGTNIEEGVYASLRVLKN